MVKTMCTIFLVIGITASLAGCSIADNPQGSSEPSVVSSVPDAPSIPQKDTSSISAAESSNEPSSEIDGMESNTNEELYSVIHDVIQQYQHAEITPDERFGILPEDFIFPVSWEMDDLNISHREVMGDYRVVLVSSDSKYEMVLISNNFTYVSGDGTVTGGDFVVTDVEFIVYGSQG